MTEDVYLGKHYLTETSGSAIETWFVVAIIILSQLRIHVNDQSKVNNQNKLKQENWSRSVAVYSRDKSVSKMCTSGGHQCKTESIPRLSLLVHPNQTWTFPVNEIIIEVPKCSITGQTCVISSNLQFVSNNFKLAFHDMC